MCNFLDRFSRIGPMSTDRMISSILHRLFPEGAALPQPRAIAAIAGTVSPVLGRLLFQSLAQKWATGNHLFSKETKLSFSAQITDTKYKTQHFLKTALQTFPRVRAVERQFAKTCWHSRQYPAKPGVPVPMPQMWNMGHPLSREL